MEKKYSRSWKSSIQRRKQRKLRVHAPLHVKQKFVNVHLAKSLREKYKTRSTQVRTGDKVKILRGQFSKKEGKVEEVSIKKSRVFVAGIELVKKDGTKVRYGLQPSNLQLIELNTDDKKRQKTLSRND